MPYIAQDRREDINPHSYDAAFPTNAGELNYVITAYLTEYLAGETNYYRINEVIGVLECAKLELYRRVAAPYEDKKKEENGDVY
jgi:hypothetical protein